MTVAGARERGTEPSHPATRNHDPHPPRLLIARARDRTTARAAIGVARGRVGKRDVELIRQRREPGECIAELVQLLRARSLTGRPRELTDLLREPRNRRGHTARPITFAVRPHHELLERLDLHRLRF